MTVQTLTKRSIVFFNVPTDFDIQTAFADAGIQQAAAASVGNVIQHLFEEHHVISGGVYTHPSALTLTFIVSAATDAAIVAGIPALRTRFPGNPITTWGETIQFGI